MNVCIVFNSSILSPKPVFLKLWVGMHNKPLSVYGYSGASKRAKGPSAPLAKSRDVEAAIFELLPLPPLPPLDDVIFA